MPQNPMPTANIIMAIIKSFFAFSGFDFNLDNPTIINTNGVNQ